MPRLYRGILCLLCIGILLLSSVSASAFSLFPQNPETIRDGDTVYTVPRLTIEQQRQEQQGEEALNQCFFQHDSSVSFPFSDLSELSTEGQQAVRMKMFFGALKRHNSERQNGQYMSCEIIPIFRMTWKKSTQRCTFYFKYHITKAQDEAFWTQCQALVKQAKISSDPQIGMQQIYDWICDHCDYDYALEKAQNDEWKNGHYDTVQPLPRVTGAGMMAAPINGKYRGVCGSFAQTYYLMCRAMGWNTVSCVRNLQHNHMYNSCVWNGTTYLIDTCFADAKDAKRSNYFFKTQDQINQIDQSHQTD